MRRKIIYDYRLKYLNDLLEIKLIFFTVLVVCINFLNLYGRYVLRYETSLTIFSLDATDRSKISSDQNAFYRIKPIPPFIFREHSH